ncbi:MAG: tetratricopeptide repeat protein [Treponema sp.]|nr:tetratricopeptide repeat protein [Treponema sp.]
MKTIHCSLLIALCTLLIALFLPSCIGMAATAEEYYSLGMAYYDLGKFEEAEKWLNRARVADRTFVASQYNLGRLAFERKNFEEAARHFEGVLRRDPDNILALRAAAYTRIRTGEIEIAQKHYSRLLYLVPESADDGYNHGLVLYAMKRYSEVEEVLDKYPFALQDNKDLQLLYARALAGQNKIEAIEAYDNWLAANTDSKARYEYGLVLEHHEFYVKALEELRKAHTETTAASTDPKRNEVRFAIARVLLVADRESAEGITEMQTAVNEGFSNIEAIEEIIGSGKISETNSSGLRSIINNLQRVEAEKIEADKTEEEEDSESDTQTGSD